MRGYAAEASLVPRRVRGHRSCPGAAPTGPMSSDRAPHRRMLAPPERPQAARWRARPNRPGGWREQNESVSVPWALPGRKSGSAPRPPRPGGRGDSPFRPAQSRRDRPDTGSTNRPTPSFRPRTPQPTPQRWPHGERGPGDRVGSSAPSRAVGRAAFLSVLNKHGLARGAAGLLRRLASAQRSQARLDSTNPDLTNPGLTNPGSPTGTAVPASSRAGWTAPTFAGGRGP